MKPHPLRFTLSLGLVIVASVLLVPATPASAGIITTTNVWYRNIDGQDLYLDVYQPDYGGPYPAVIVAFGGGWGSGTKEGWTREGNWLAESGFVAVIPQYRLAPPGGDSHAIDPVYDLQAAAQWIRANAATYNINPAKVGALGGSSGGNLTQMLSVLGTPGDDKVEAVVSWSGISDLTLHPGDKEGKYVGCDLDECPDLWVAASPITFVTSDDAPIFLANSTDEIIPIQDPLNMKDALAAAGVSYTLRLVAGNQHGRGYEPLVWDESVAFLHTKLDARTSPVTTITGSPHQPIDFSTAATFTFKSSAQRATLTCQIDGSVPALCTSPMTYTGLTYDYHTFGVYSTDSQGNKGPEVTHHWEISADATHVTLSDTGFGKTAQSVKQDRTIQWDVSGTKTHQVTDGSGMGLFDSGVLSPGQSYSFVFIGAATYTVLDSIGGKTMTVTCAVVAGPLSGPLTDPYLVTWTTSARNIPAGYVFDVQVKKPGSTTFVDWKVGIALRDAIYTPDSIGTYTFQARMRNASTGAASNWSPVASVTVT